MIYNTQEELDEALAQWQKILRLQDWEIKASIVRRKELPQPCNGINWTSFAKKRCTIRIVDPVDFEDETTLPEWQPVCHERTLVHELLHILFDPIFPKEEGPLYDLAEQTIESLASSFVAQYQPVTRTLVP